MKKNQQNNKPKTVDHFIPAKDKRRDRHAMNLLKNPNAVEDWDDEDICWRESRFKKGQKID